MESLIFVPTGFFFRTLLPQCHEPVEGLGHDLYIAIDFRETICHFFQVRAGLCNQS